MHKKIRKAQCEKCGKTFYLESQLKRHEQDVHSYWDLETLWEIIEDIIIIFGWKEFRNETYIIIFYINATTKVQLWAEQVGNF